MDRLVLTLTSEGPKLKRSGVLLLGPYTSLGLVSDEINTGQASVYQKKDAEELCPRRGKNEGWKNVVRSAYTQGLLGGRPRLNGHLLYC